jgi:hypothetical protein
MEIPFAEITLQDLQAMGPKIKLRSEGPVIPGYVILKGHTFAHFLCFYKDHAVRDIEKVFTYIFFLDSDLIKLLNRIILSRYLVLCDDVLKNITLWSDPDLTSFDDALLEYHSAIKDLEMYALKHNIFSS